MAVLSNCVCLLLPLFCVVVYAQMQTEPSITSSVHLPRTPVSYRGESRVLYLICCVYSFFCALLSRAQAVEFLGIVLAGAVQVYYD